MSYSYTTGIIEVDTSAAFSALFDLVCYYHAPGPQNFLAVTKSVQIDVLDTTACDQFIVASQNFGALTA